MDDADRVPVTGTSEHERRGESPIMTKAVYRAVAASAPFRLESMARVTAPDGSAGEWHRYVITQGTDQNRIVGMRAGTHVEVSERLDAMIECLNERRLGVHRPKTGRNAGGGRG